MPSHRSYDLQVNGERGTEAAMLQAMLHAMPWGMPWGMPWSMPWGMPLPQAMKQTMTHVIQGSGKRPGTLTSSRLAISARHIGHRWHCIEHSMQKSVWLQGKCRTVVVSRARAWVCQPSGGRDEMARRAGGGLR